MKNAKVRQALMGGFASSRILEVHGERMIKRTFDPGFRIELHQKDLNLALQGAREIGVALPQTASAAQLMQACAANGMADLDHSALVKALGRGNARYVGGAVRDTLLGLEVKDIDLASYHFSTLFVDPPRSGLDATTLEFAAGFDHILYISCNPQTLQENVAALQATHTVKAAAVFDQFPYTHHLESGLLLTRR